MLHSASVAKLDSNPFVLLTIFIPLLNPEPQPSPDVLRENLRTSILHGGAQPGGHAHLDGRHCDGCR